MKRLTTGLYCISLVCITAACNNGTSTNTEAAKDTIKAPVKGTYSYDVAFMKKNTRNVLELQDETGSSKVLLSADYQGRVMTSTAAGDSGSSFGWINYGLISSGEKKQHMNPVGGEERFWMGPEGGQYSIYFKKGDSFNFAHWFVPAVLDTVTYDIVQSDKSQALFSKNTELTNYSGTVFTIGITRKITLLNKSQLEERLKTNIPAGVSFVGFESDNQIKNNGNNDWKKSNGLLSIWILCMMNPSDETKVIIPFNHLPNVRSYITDNYFGAIPANRLIVKDSILYFRCDGKARGKIGISPLIAKPITGSFDFSKNILTILVPQLDKTASYVNSKWEIQKQPYKGDVINSYNDGPLADGSQMGPFYEIESSSAGKELKKGEVQEYKQTTCHFQGDYKSLSELAKQLLGINLDDVKSW
jgi:hypothetical protein